ncbi:MAG: hypothetical protein ABJA89_01880, partial [Lapillicoccus sp.]
MSDHERDGASGHPTGSTPPAAQDRSARTKLVVAAVVGVLVGVGSAVVGAGKSAPLIGWDALALTFCVWMWASIWKLDPEAT